MYITTKEEYNRLISEYPFLKRRNRWSDEECDDCYKFDDGTEDWFTELSEMPDGWRIAFGEDMCKELKELLVKYNYLDGYRIMQIKEKYGTLRWYDNGFPKDGWNEYVAWLNKYENLSKFICIKCGKPATHITKSWISPYCTECALKIEHDSNGWEQIEKMNEDNWYIKGDCCNE